MWNKIKNFFKIWTDTVVVLNDPHIEMYERDEFTVEALQKMTKGDRKKLKAQGKIKSIEYPFY